MTRRRGALLLVTVLLLLLALVPTTRAAFGGASSVSGSVASDALAARLAAERPAPALARPGAAAEVRYVEQLRPRGGGLISGAAAARAADGLSATVAETGSDRLRLPVNGGLDAGTDGWTPSTSNALLGQADHVPTGGDPGGALRFSASSSTTGPTAVTATWSTSFPHTGRARAVSLRHDVRVAAAGGLTGASAVEVALVSPSGTATVLSRSPVAAGPSADGAGPWRTTTGTATGSAVAGAGTYVLRLTAQLHLAQGSGGTVVVLVDDVELDITGAVLTPEPANGRFDPQTGTDGWTSVATGLGVPSFSPSDGEPVGSMRVSVTGGAFAATGTVDWSTTFQHDGGSAGRATLAFSHRILLGNEVTEQTGYTVRLEEPSGAVTELAPFHQLVPVAYPGLDPGWTRRTVVVPPSALDETGTYRLSVYTEIYSNAVVNTNLNAVGLSIGYDNIHLERVATGRHVDVEAVVPAAFRSTARLEWRASTTGDPVAVAVWSRGTWRPLTPVTASTLTTGSTTLRHREDAAEAEVRLRFTSAAADGADDELKLDFVRVVPTDPPLHEADTDLLLPSVATGDTASRLPGVVRLRNRSSAPLTLTVAADAPVLAWAGFDADSVLGGATCTAGWTDGAALTTRCTLPPAGSVAVDVRVVGGRAPATWAAALVLTDADRPDYFRTVLPATVLVTP